MLDESIQEYVLAMQHLHACALGKDEKAYKSAKKEANKAREAYLKLIEYGVNKAWAAGYAAGVKL